MRSNQQKRDAQAVNSQWRWFNFMKSLAARVAVAEHDLGIPSETLLPDLMRQSYSKGQILEIHGVLIGQSIPQEAVANCKERLALLHIKNGDPFN